MADLKALHAAEAAKAKDIYLGSRTPLVDAQDWLGVLRNSRKQIANALRASNYLTNVAGALTKSGEHMLTFRHITAPPISQDQFKLVCPNWQKSSEKPNGKVSTANAPLVEVAFESRRSRSLTPWIDARRKPFKREIRRLFWSVAPLIASQQIQTVQRTRAANAQEGAVIDMLNRKGWTKEPSLVLDKRASLPAKHYMHKTRFATASTTPQEVDVALGMKNTIVLAMECKVSNDETNSIKRINDVLKKSAAWKTHWGSFVKTAALLQGVIAAKEVWRLIDEGVEVFWSHDLAAFETWIDNQL